MNETTNTTLTPAEREHLTGLLQETLEKYERSIAGLSPEQASFKPDPERWSVNEVLEHIVTVEKGIFNIVRAELEKPEDAARRAEIQVGDDQIVPKVTNRSYRVKGSEQTAPKGRFQNTGAAAEAFRHTHREISDFISSTTVNLRERYWKHPATGVIDLYQTLIWLNGHTQRHLLQIEELKEDPGYPG